MDSANDELKNACLNPTSARNSVHLGKSIYLQPMTMDYIYKMWFSAKRELWGHTYIP